MTKPYAVSGVQLANPHTPGVNSAFRTAPARVAQRYFGIFSAFMRSDFPTQGGHLRLCPDAPFEFWRKIIMLAPHFKFSAILLLLVGPAQAALAPDVIPDPSMHAWFESLRQPKSHAPCCSISDCHFTAYEEHKGHFEVTVDGWPYIVPEGAVVRDNRSPTDQAVICYNYTNFGLPTASGAARIAPQDEIEILCFLPSQPQS